MAVVTSVHKHALEERAPHVSRALSALGFRV